MTIKSLDDITLIPTPVRISYWEKGGRAERIEEEMCAKLFPELIETQVTMLAADACGDPFSKVGRLRYAMISPRAAGGSSPWGLMLGIVEKRNRNPAVFKRNFPTAPVILLCGEHALDFYLRDLPPVMAATGIRSHCASYTTTWQFASNYCRGTVPEDLLIDTTEAATAWHRARFPERYGEVAS